MKRVFPLVTLLIHCLYGFGLSVGDIEYARFDHFTTREGLSSNRVFSLAQDSTGFVWVATDFGLDRFDGINFKHYQKKDYPKMKRNEIMYVDHIGHDQIFAAGPYGVFIEYDKAKDDFSNIMPTELDSIAFIQIKGVHTSGAGERYLFANGGIFHYNAQSGRYDSHFEAHDSLRIDFINTLFIDDQKRFWIGSINHLDIIDEKGHKVKVFSQEESCGYVTTILPIAPNKVAIAFQNNQLWIVETQSVSPSILQKITLPFNTVMNMLRTYDGRFWFATDGDGLWFTDDEITPNARFKSLVPYGELQAEMKKIYAIKEGIDGGIWFGTQNSGIWHYNRKSDECVIFSGDIGLPTEVCSSFEEGEDGTLYVGTDGNGLYAISPDREKITHHNLPGNNITGLNRQGDHILTSTWGAGLLDFDINTGKASPMAPQGIEHPVPMYFSVGSKEGLTWACTGNDDLYFKKGNWSKLELKDDSFPNLGSKWISKVIPGANNSLWVLATNMLWKITGGKIQAIHPELYTEQPNDPLFVFDAECDEEGNLFTTSNHGVFRFSKDGKEVERLDFLPDYSQRIIKRDTKGQFWTASFDGIIHFDYNKRTFAHLPGDYEDISKSFFYIKSSFRDSKGRIYFGTNGGFYTFDPNHVDPDMSIHHLAFSELFITRKKIEPGTSVLEEGRLSELKQLMLQHGMTDISIAVDVIDHAKFNKAKIRYRLIGMQDDWIDIGTQRQINFSHIPTGDYTLEVEAFRPLLNDCEKRISLKITVLPPWWNTWWFISLIVLLFLGLFFLIFRRRLQKLEEEQAVLQKRVDERTSELKEVLQDKDRLISVIAHDLKNPMFAIVGALETWKNKGKELGETETEQLVQETYDSSITLQREMLNLLDWAKSKRDEIICHPKEIDLRYVVNNVVLLLKGMMEDKKITLSQSHNLSHYAFADSRMIGTVVRNLLSNAIKFTPKNGTIQIRSWQENDQISLEISDSGVGMDTEQIIQLQSGERVTSTAGTENEKGTGLGFRICQDYIQRNNGTISLSSEKGKGTTIHITLPASKQEITEGTPQPANTAQINIDRSVLEGNTILIVDDDSLICNNIKNILSEYVQTLVAKDGQEGTQLAETHQPDLILSDVDMPTMNGIEMCKALSLSDRTKGVPILFISANNEESDRLTGLLSGAIDYIAKPFSQSELLLKIYNLLNIRKEQQKRLLTELMIKGEHITEQESEQEEKINPFLKTFLEVVEEKHVESQITIEDLAQAMAVSQPTLNRKIRSLTGKTPLEVLNEYRLNHALRLLQDSSSDDNVADVAYSVGFNDPSYFTKKFRDFFGYLPSQAQNK